MSWFANFRKRRAVKKYVKKLGPRLRKKYGKANSYTSGQIRTASKEISSNPDHIWLGYAMFLGVDSFNMLPQDPGTSCDYHTLREDVANVCFSGDSNFTVTDVISYGVSSGGVSGSFFGDGDGGSFGDGGSGGGGDGGG